jgi:AcrR family transcriptional regulator
LHVKYNVLVDAQMTRRAEYAAETRAALVEAATTLFAERGYAAVSTGDIVDAARLTRGALYHHFKDKPDLMRAVFISVEHALVDRVAAAIADAPDPATRLGLTWPAFLEATADLTTRRIVFVEAPAALGWEEWRRLDGGRSLALVVDTLRELQDTGRLDSARDVTVLGHLVLGAINEAGLYIGSSRQPRRARDRVEGELHRFFEELIRPNAVRGPSPRS